MADLNTNETDEVTLADSAGVNKATIAPTGDLKVAQRSISPVSDVTKLYAASFDVNVPTSSTETNLALIRNPAGSGKTLRLIEVGTDISSTVAAELLARLYVSPTVTTTGTGQTETSLAVGGGAPASVMTIFSSPTTSSSGARIDSWLSSSGAAASSYSSEFDGMVTVSAGNDLLLTGTADGLNRNVLISIWWLEE